MEVFLVPSRQHYSLALSQTLFITRIHGRSTEELACDILLTGSTSTTRAGAMGGALGVERLPGMLTGRSAREAPIPIDPPSEGEDIVADYRGLGLTLGRHPLPLLRGNLNRLKVERATELSALSSRRKVRVAGIVTHRQRPETASGVVFMSLEDETGISNLIVWTTVQQQQREDVVGAKLLVVEGELQNEMNIIHVVAQKCRDYSQWLDRITTGLLDFHWFYLQSGGLTEYLP